MAGWNIVLVPLPFVPSVLTTVRHTWKSKKGAFRKSINATSAVLKLFIYFR